MENQWFLQHKVLIVRGFACSLLLLTGCLIAYDWDAPEQTSSPDETKPAIESTVDDKGDCGCGY